MSSPVEPTLTPPTAAAPPGPVLTRTEVVWRGERLFDAGPVGRTHRIDASAKEAPGPVETLLNAVATCSGVDVIDIIAKRKTPVERMVINVVAERREEFPRRVQRMEIEFRIDGAGIEREHAERAIQLSYERYCSVATSLAPDIVTETKLTLNGESFPAVRQKVWTPST
ncbi:MAG: OsmC family protein [Gemmatimonadetes bacterium]|nr:OsmC family protein [Gemmatimonadota bacterium]